MNKAIVAGVVLGSITTWACAQHSDTGSSGGPRALAQARDCAGCAAPADGGAADDLDDDGVPVVREPMGGHEIAVFSGEPGMARMATTVDNGVADPRRRQAGAMERVGPSPGAGGFTLGRQLNLEYLSDVDVADPFHAGTAGRASNLVTPSGKRVDSNVGYFSSAREGVSGRSSYTLDTAGGDPVADRAWGLSVGYDYGALSLRAAHQNRHVAQIHLYDLAGGTMEARNSIVAANLRTHWGTAYAAYSANRGWGSSPLYNPDNPYSAGVASTSSTDSRDMLMGVAVPMTNSTTFLASTIRRNDHDLAHRDASMVAFGASYVVSRKTDFYAAFTHTVNVSGNGNLIGGAARPSGSAAVNVGMRHSF